MPKNPKNLKKILESYDKMIETLVRESHGISWELIEIYEKREVIMESIKEEEK